MRRTNKTVGTGMTKRAIVTFDWDDPADVDAQMQAAILALDRTSFDRLSKRIVGHAQQILAQAGLPTEANDAYAVTRKKGWKRLKRTRRPKRATHQGLALSGLLLQLGHALDSPEGYAARVLSVIGEAGRLRDAGQLDEAMAMVFAVGSLISEARMRETREPDARRKDSSTLVQEAFQTYLGALAALMRAQGNDGRDPDTGQTADEAAKTYYESMGNTLRAFNALGNWRRDGSAKEPLPRQLAFDVGQLVDDLLAGRIRPSVAHLFFGRGRPSMGAIQRRAVEAAVRYMAAAQHGLIDELNPIGRVAQAFGVTGRTARRWMAEHPTEVALVMQLKRTPARDGLKEMLIRHMEEDATLYKQRRHVKTRR